ncbi:ABC transporter ATP-binding protein [Glaciihabitans arcticus]|uniref:ABC transporter ATP-binding protein n=1 Tax=Glaciihabitans arcticus TaxID=2668039 RepID=A0A4Q9GPU5_9MICO|nr:ABC transporter ATP-binding protein [Glaciihabitans arcticus]TBN55954.1 ABC transporter ATP-binding protein [Glaciihabitans arcticus]
MKSTWALYRELLTVLPAGAQRFLAGYSVTLGLLSMLDALALGLLALVITPIISGTTLTLPIIGQLSELGLLLMLGLACVLIVLKGVLAVALLWRATRRFAKYELAIGSRLFGSYVVSPWVERLKRNSSDIVRLADGSVGVTVSGFILPGSTLFGEVLSFLTIVIVLAVVQPLVAVISLAYLGALGAILFFWVTKRSRQAGRINLQYTLKTSRMITEMIGALKEVTLRNKAGEVAEIVKANRFHSTRARSNIQFLGQVPRYVLESGIIGGFVLVGVAGYLSTGDAAGAITAVALFGLAGFRMAPSVVRFQAVVSQVTSNMPHAKAVLNEIRRSEKSIEHLANRTSLPVPPNPKSLDFEDVTFRYAPDAPDAVTSVSASIPFGSSVAFVGASGAGKSTIIDLILGLIEPTEGRIAIDGTSLTELTTSWRSQVGYVPQDVSLFDATIAENVALSWSGEIDDDRVRSALAQAQMLDIVEARPDGIHGTIGERGLALSGGQRQRLGIARALYAEPLVLVMDEATSALDTATEAAVTDAIRALRGKMTIITVAHRLATIQHSDDIFFMSGGRVAAHGKFDELVASMPEFAIQATLAGLAERGGDPIF